MDPCNEQTGPMIESEKAQGATMLNFAQKRMKMGDSLTIGGHGLSNTTGTKSQASSNIDAEDNAASIMQKSPAGTTRVADGDLAKDVENLPSASSPTHGDGPSNERDANKSPTTRPALGTLSDRGNGSRKLQEKDQRRQKSPSHTQNGFALQKVRKRCPKVLNKTMRKKLQQNNGCQCISLDDSIVKGLVTYPTMQTFHSRLGPAEFQNNITQVAKCPFHERNLISWCQAIVAQVCVLAFYPPVSIAVC